MDWEKSKFGDVFIFIKNGASIKQDEQANGIPITRIETIADGTINCDRFGYADLFDASAYENYLLTPGDILMSHINSTKHLGKSALYQGRPDILIHGMNLLCLRPNYKILDSDFALSFLRSRAFLNQISRITKNSVNQASFTVTSLKELEFPLPDLSTQQHIAAVLDKADALRQQNRQLLTYYDELLQSTFIELFGDPVNNEKGWEVKKLGDNVRIVGGGTPSRENESFFTGDICWATSKDIKSDYLLDTKEHVTEEAIDKSATKLVEAGTILLVVKSKILAHTLPITISNVPVCFGQDLKGIIPKKSLNTKFLVYVLKTSKSKLLTQARGVNTEGLTLEHLNNFPIPLPPLSLQNQFADIVEKIEAQKEQARAALAESEALFEGLLAGYFGEN